MDGTAQPCSASRIGAGNALIVARWALICSAVLLIVFAALLLVRGASGHFVPLSPAVLLVTVASLAVAADFWRVAALRTGIRWFQRIWIQEVAASLACSLLLLAISIRGTTIWVTAMAWCALVSNEALYFVVRHWKINRRSRLRSRPLAVGTPRIQGPNPLEAHTSSALSQSVQRWIEGGDEIVAADYLCVFEPHERQQAIHLVFCPPLVAVPTITSQSRSGPAVTLKISQCYCYGARLEVRLASPSSARAEVVVRVLARASLDRGGGDSGVE